MVKQTPSKLKTNETLENLSTEGETKLKNSKTTEKLVN